MKRKNYTIVKHHPLYSVYAEGTQAAFFFGFPQCTLKSLLIIFDETKNEKSKR